MSATPVDVPAATDAATSALEVAPPGPHLGGSHVPEARGKGWMPARLWASRELIGTLIKRDLKVRYKSSALGFLWSFGRPLLLLLVIWAVFATIVRVPSSHPLLPYPLHLLTTLLPWMFLSTALAEALYSVLANGNVVKKIWLPVETFPVATVLGHLIHLLLAGCVLAVFIGAYAIFGRTPEGQPLGMMVLPGWEIVLLPLLILLQTLLLLGLALIVSSLNVFYRDVGSITEIVLSAWFYLTPVIYPANFAREEFKARGLEFLYWLWLANPMTPIMLAYRRVVYGPLFRDAPEVSDTTLLLGLGLSTATTLIVLAVGMTLFERLRPRFADEL